MEDNQKSTNMWQLKLLPFSIIFLSILLIVYFVIYYFELQNIHQIQYTNKRIGISENIAQLKEHNNSIEEKLFTAELLSILNRQENARIIIQSRLLTISLSFLTGVVLAFMGAIFILGKFSEKETQIKAENNNASFSLQSSSPGIILSTLGVLLITICILSKSSLEVTESPLYLNGTFEIKPKPSIGDISILDSLIHKTDKKTNREKNN